MKDHKHGLTETEDAELLDLRDCAWAPPSHSNDQAEDSLYHLAVDRLKAPQVWLQNDYLQTWLNNYWLSIPKVKFTHVFAWEQMPVVPKFEGVY